jgi:ATP-dependent DNA helicase RecG
MKRLIDMGIIEHTGRGKYVLARGIYGAVGKSGVYTRTTGLDKNTNKELVLKHIRDNGKNGTPLSEVQQVLPNYSRYQIQALLRELRDENKIFLSGKTNGAKWYIT